MDEIYKVIWQNTGRKWYIMVDEYGLGISDEWNVDRPIVYDDNTVAYDFPERLPKYVKTKMSNLAKKYGADAFDRFNNQIYKTFGIEI